MPDRVIDAPIPDDMIRAYRVVSAYAEGGDNPPISPSFVKRLIERIARLEAEKQAAHTEGWNAAIEKAAVTCEQMEWEDCTEAATRIRRHLEPTAAKPEPSLSSAKQGEPS